jgi:hypothetical protein
MLRIQTLLAVLTLAVTTPALAAEPAYVGTWGSNRAQCKIAQDQQNAPMVVRAKGYDQHEAHCTFASVAPAGRAWKVQANCSVEGDKQSMALQLRVLGNRLIMTRSKSLRTFVRCQ